MCTDYFDTNSILQCREAIATQVSQVCSAGPLTQQADSSFTSADWLNLLSPGNLVRSLARNETVGGNVGSLWICYVLGLACLLVLIYLILWIPRRLFNAGRWCCPQKKASTLKGLQSITPSHQQKRWRIAWVFAGLCLAGGIGTVVASMIYTLRLRDDVAKTSCAVAQSMFEVVYHRTPLEDGTFEGIAKLIHLLDASANMSQIYTSFVTGEAKGTMGAFMSVAALGVFAPVQWTDFMLSKQAYSGWLDREGIDRAFTLELTLPSVSVIEEALALCDQVPCVPEVATMIVDSSPTPLDERVRSFAGAVEKAVGETKSTLGDFLSKLSKIQHKHFDVNEEITNGPWTKAAWITPVAIQALTMAVVLFGGWFAYLFARHTAGVAWTKEDPKENRDRWKAKGLRWFCYVCGWGCLVYLILGSIGVCVSLFFTQTCDVVFSDVLSDGDIGFIYDEDVSIITQADVETCLLKDGSGDLLEAHGYIADSPDYARLFGDPFDSSAWPIEQIIKDNLNVLIEWGSLAQVAAATDWTEVAVSDASLARTTYTDSRISQSSIDDESIKTINRVLNQMLGDDLPYTLCVINDSGNTCSETDLTSLVEVNSETVYNYDPQGIRGVDFGYLMGKTDEMRSIFDHLALQKTEAEMAQFANAIYIAALRSAAIQSIRETNSRGGNTIRSGEVKSTKGNTNKVTIDKELGEVSGNPGLARNVDPHLFYNKWENRMLFDPCPPLQPCGTWFIFDDLAAPEVGFGGLKLGAFEDWKDFMGNYIESILPMTIDDLVKTSLAVLMTTNPFETLQRVVNTIPGRFSCQIVRHTVDTLATSTCSQVGKHIGTLTHLWLLLALLHGGAFVLMFIHCDKEARPTTTVTKQFGMDSDDDSSSTGSELGQFGFEPAGSFHMTVVDEKPKASEVPPSVVSAASPTEPPETPRSVFIPSKALTTPRSPGSPTPGSPRSPRSPRSPPPGSPRVAPIDRDMLIDAAMRGRMDILIQHRDKLRFVFDSNMNSLLHLAAYYGHAEAVAFLKEYSDVSCVNKLGYTAAGAVAVNQNMSSVQREVVLGLLADA